MTTALRFAAVKFQHWSLVSSGVDLHLPFAATQSGFIVDCSPPAAIEGVRAGQRKREAMRLCPGMRLIEVDAFRNTHTFEPVIKALMSVTPRLELSEPGFCTLPVAGAAKYYGGEAALINALVHVVEQLQAPTGGTHPVEVMAVGIADSRFAARQAALHQSNLTARSSDGDPPLSASTARLGLIVPAGRTADFLAPLPVETLEVDELQTLSRRLGIYTLGEFAALPTRSVLSRFGSSGAHAQLLAKGQDPQPLSIHTPAEELIASAELDPPADRVDMATFAAKPIAEGLVEMLTRRGLACTQLRIEAHTEHAEVNVRLWRANPIFDVETIVARVRWQLNGWLSAGSTAHQPTAGISLIRIAADEVGNAADLQMGLWGELSEIDRRAIRGLDRVQGLLGTSGVFTSQLASGRFPKDRVTYTPWGQPIPPSAPPQPWPGQLPTPSPSLLHRIPIPVEVIGEQGPVSVSPRGEVSTEPLQLRTQARTQSGQKGPAGLWRTIKAWTGPWLSGQQQWWEGPRQNSPEQRLDHSHRFQVVTNSPEHPDSQAAHLCLVQRDQWWIEATYD